jgi:hypothetical protein
MDNWSSRKAANPEGLVSKRHSDPPGNPKTAGAAFQFPVGPTTIDPRLAQRSLSSFVRSGAKASYNGVAY